MRAAVLLVVIALFGLSDGASLASPAGAPAVVTAPAWSPDGTRLAFAGEPVAGGRSDVYTIGVSGGEPLNVTADDAQTDHEFPAWSPAGSRIASVTAFGGPNANSEIYSISAASAGQTTAVADSTATGPISWSRDGRWIAFDSRFSAEIARTDGSAHRTLAANAGSAVWAPYALRLAAAVLQRDGSNTDIELLGPTGELVRKLTRTRLSETPIRWSRDGRRLLFASDRSGAWDLYVMRSDGTAQRRIAPGRAGDFSPTGRRVVYAGKTGIWVVGIDGSGRRRIAVDGAQPQWSPDGRWVAFVTGRVDGTVGIDLVRPDGSDRHALVGS